ncbi:MAG: preprotein translocase subunit YajC [Actinobacteria bacterium]|nr:preprotein translocase subunit YajC [Actinomycetota bacterium]
MRSIHSAASVFAADSNSGGGAAIAQLAIFGLIGLAMYFLLIRPQRRRQREQVALQKNIEVGDEVMTTAGLYGFVTGFDGDIAWIEIDDNVQIRVARQAIHRKVDTAKGETATPPNDATLPKNTAVDGDITASSPDES